MPSLHRMAKNPTSRSNNIPFIAIESNVGSTTHWSSKKKTIAKQQWSFGRPSFFFRFNFTSAISDIPYARVHWVDFIARAFTRTAFMGDISQESWESSPGTYYSYHPPFIKIDYIKPSRFLLAFHQDREVAFLALDQERLGDIANDGDTTDFGDDILHYKKGKPFEYDQKTDTYVDAGIVHTNVVNFMTTNYRS
jgi:hypothetical protein